MTDLNNFQSINLSQFFDSVKFRSGSGYPLVIDFCIVMFYMLMILMKFSFVPQTFFRIFFFLGTGSGFHHEIHLKKLFFMYKDAHQIWFHSAKFLSKSKFCSGSGSGSWYYFGFQYQTYISYTEDTHQIFFGSANSFKSSCVHSESPRTYSQTSKQTDGNFFLLVLSKTSVFFGFVF